jgi:DNA-binding transcriptional LysR family regulator
MELRHLRYFVAVAGELNFTRAARNLRVAQPALSRQIRQLEEELGVQLLERDNRSVTLTEAGRAFAAEAQALLKQSDEAVRTARKSGGAGDGTLTVGYVWGLFHSVVPSTLERFRRASPDTAVHLFDLTAMQQAKALSEGRLDAGFIGFADEADAAGLSKRKVGSCSFVAALPKQHRAARQTRVPLSSLAEDFFLGISDQSYPGAWRHVMEACGRAGFRPRTLQMVERGYTILGLVAARCGVALLPEPLQALPHDGIVFRPLTDPPIGDLYVAWRGSQPRPALEKLLGVVESAPDAISGRASAKRRG